MHQARYCVFALAVALVAAASVLLAPAFLGCSGNKTPATKPKTGPSAGGNGGLNISLNPGVAKTTLGPKIPPRLVDVAKELGVDFSFYADVVPDRYFLPEVMGGGAAWLDFDGDGWLDLYLQNGAPLKDPDPSQTKHTNRLYRNIAGERFEEVAVDARALHGGYGQGLAVGDFNADGFDDLYLANFGRNSLLENNGDGTFTDITDAAGVSDPKWSTSCLWVDLNGDDNLDLYVANYLNVTFETHQVCYYGEKPGYCGPGKYEPEHDSAFINQGDGTFVESSERLGLRAEEGKGLAVTAVDFDNDRKPDIYVANDMAPNFLFTRSPLEGDQLLAVYRNQARKGGCAVAENGQLEASMGISCGDFDGDGLPDIYLTHFHNHKNTLYHNLGRLSFEDISKETNVAPISYETLGFGTVPFDYDRDGALDIFITNGHVLGPLHKPNEMRPQLIRNDGEGNFSDLTPYSGEYFEKLWIGRGAAGADFDHDGDCDLAVTHVGQPYAVLRNGTETGRHFIGLKLQTAKRSCLVGARVEFIAGSKTWIRHITSGGSYLCSGDPRLLQGIGDHDKPVTVIVHWPSGKSRTYETLGVDQYWLIIEEEEALPLPILH